MGEEASGEVEVEVKLVVEVVVGIKSVTSSLVNSQLSLIVSVDNKSDVKLVVVEIRIVQGRLMAVGADENEVIAFQGGMVR